MDVKKFHKHLDEMYKEPKSRGFVNHLIRAYFPITNVEKVWDGPRRGFVCALSGDQLISANDIIVNFSSDENRADFLKYLYLEMNDGEVQTKHPIENALDGKQLGVTGKDTTTFLSIEAYREFYNWLVNKILSGDKGINGIIKHMRSKSMLSNIGAAAKTDDAKKIVTDLKKYGESTKKATLGDLDVLKELKAKMDGTGK